MKLGTGGREKIQMSEAVSTGVFLTLSGGFQDAYTYFCRGKVFANAQTGNIVLWGTHMAKREWGMALRYLAPILAFVAGVYVAEHIRRVHRERAIWMSCAMPLVSFFIMFAREEEAEKEKTKV